MTLTQEEAVEASLNDDVAVVAAATSVTSTVRPA